MIKIHHLTGIITIVFILILIGPTQLIAQKKSEMKTSKQIKVGLNESLSQLDDSRLAYIEFFKHGSMRIGMYGPEKIDHQHPHEQDELYVIAEGSGKFIADGVTHSFEKGDVLFVAAHAEHRFTDFSDDFRTWVFFYGPVGGEMNQDE